MPTSNLGSSSLPTFPSLAIIIPCRNERGNIRRFLDNVLAMDYGSSKICLLIVDGMSTDGTREFLDSWKSRDSRIRVLDNPTRGTAAALNIGIRASSSDVVVRLDVRTSYPRNYISHLVQVLSEERADNVGCVRVTDPGDTAWSRAISSLVSHRFATGDARWRSGADALERADSVYCGCFRREVFETAGLFDEKIVRIEDRELNHRLTAAGGLILLDPSLHCTYYPRRKLPDYCKWTFQGAFHLFQWSLVTDPGMLRSRNFIPIAFLLYQLLPILTWGSAWFIPSLLPFVVYWILNICFALSEAIRFRCLPVAPLLAAGFYLTHLIYGAGSLSGVLRYVLRTIRFRLRGSAGLAGGVA